MAYDVGTTTVVGNLTKDPVLRGEGDGKRATFSVAVNSGKDDKQKTAFLDVTAFGRLGENVAKSLRQGQRVIVYGALNQYTIEATIDGEKKNITKTSINAYNVGPDLTFVEVEVTANPRSNGQSAPAAAARETADVF